MAISEWSRVLTTTIHNYAKGSEDNTLRNQKFFAKLKAEGRLEFNCSGDMLDWGVEIKNIPMQPIGDMPALTYQRSDVIKRAQLEWRGLAGTDAISYKEKLMNKGPEALIKIVSEIVPRLAKNAEFSLGGQIYVDGNAANYTDQMHGLESFFGNSGAASGGYVGTPSDTYAGLSTALANYGGTWTGNWPAGTGDAQYDAWSPLIVDYTDTAWTPATKTWPNTCVEAMSYGIIKGQRNRSKDAQLDLILLENQLYLDFKNALETKERAVITRGDDKNGMWSLGFKDVINWSGVDVTFEYGVPANVGYGLAFGAINFCSLHDKIFQPVGPYFEPSDYSTRFSINTFGNFKMNPRYQVKWLSIT